MQLGKELVGTAKDSANIVKSSTSETQTKKIKSKNVKDVGNVPEI